MSSLVVYDCIVLPGDPRTVLHGPRLYSHSRSDALVRGLVPSVVRRGALWGGLYSHSFIHSYDCIATCDASNRLWVRGITDQRARQASSHSTTAYGAGEVRSWGKRGTMFTQSGIPRRLDWLRTAIARRTHVLTFLS